MFRCCFAGQMDARWGNRRGLGSQYFGKICGVLLHKKYRVARRLPVWGFVEVVF